MLAHEHALPHPLLLRLLSSAAEEYREESYDINRIARQAILAEGGEDQQLSQQIILFCALLGRLPQYFLDLLNEELLSSHSHIVTLNSRNHLLAARFLADARCPHCLQDEQVAEAAYALVNAAARKVGKVYEECAGLVRGRMEELARRVKHSRLMNNFILYKLFREIAEAARREVQERGTETALRHCPAEVVELFFHYVINKHEVVRLFASQEIGPAMFEPSPAVLLANFERNPDVDLLAREAVSSEGRCAIFLKTYSEKPEVQRGLEDYLLVLEEGALRVLNCKTLRKRWFVAGDLRVRAKLSLMAREYIADSQYSLDALRRDRPQPVEQLLECQPLESYTNFNGILGRCLYLMKRYKGANDFFRDLSKRAILTRSMEEVMYQLPVVGYMIFAGTFSASFYRIFSNRFSTEKKKLQELGGFMLATSATVGTSILGAITGQMLIPIPVVGALIGSVLGGFLGDRGGRQLNSWIEQKKFLETVKYLREAQVDQQHWRCTPEFYKALEIKESEFRQYLPAYLQDHVFATLIAFVLVCFYESKRLNAYNLERARRLGGGGGEGGYLRRQQALYEEISRMGLEEEFETEFNITRTVQFLEAEGGTLDDHYDTLEQSILSNLAKIIH